VYHALIDADAIAKWRVPSGMSSVVHEFDAREGGSFRVSLTYDAPTGTGKSAAHTDTYHGHFVALVPNERVVELLEFETADPAFRGQMTMTTTLTDGCPYRPRRHSRQRASRRQRDWHTDGARQPRQVC
jgi:uncharacterized protein YndB with AHSA1/START domain